MASNRRIVSILATGTNTSSKSMPCSGVGGVIGPHKSPYTKSNGDVDLAFAFFGNGVLLCFPIKQTSQICVACLMVLSLPIASSRVISSKSEYCSMDATI
nr:hypothetical protein [Tanacetum cinerariifolium]